MSDKDIFGINLKKYKICKHCNGYGSSFKDPVGVNVCSKCGGKGLLKKQS